MSDIEWMPGLPTGGYADDYGAKAVTFEAHTISSRATVKYQILDMKGNAIQGYEAKNLTNENGSLWVWTYKTATLETIEISYI